MAVNTKIGFQSQIGSGIDENKNELQIKEQFDSAVNLVRTLPKSGPFQPPVDMQLRFYSLFKQATEGKCRMPKPSFWDVVAKKKWEAWTSLENTSSRDAMLMYAQELRKLIESAPPCDERDRLLSKLNVSTGKASGVDLQPPLANGLPLATKGNDHCATSSGEQLPNGHARHATTECVQPSVIGENDAKAALTANGVQNGKLDTCSSTLRSESETEFEDAQTGFADTCQSEYVRDTSAAQLAKKAGGGKEGERGQGTSRRVTSSSGQSYSHRATSRDQQANGTATRGRARLNGSGSDEDDSRRRNRQPTTASRPIASHPNDELVAELLRVMLRVQQDVVQLGARLSSIETQLSVYTVQLQFAVQSSNSQPNAAVLTNSQNGNQIGICCSVCGARVANAAQSLSVARAGSAESINGFQNANGGLAWRSILAVAVWPILLQLISWYLLRRWRRARNLLWK